MKINKKQIKISCILVLIAFGVLMLQLYAKKYLKDLIIEKIPSNYFLKYDEVEISILFGNVILSNALVKIKDKDASEYHTFIKTENLKINDIGYWDLLFDETLSIKSVLLKNPKLHYYPYKHIAFEKTKTNIPEKGLKTLNIKEIAITNGSITVMKKSADSIKMTISSYDLTILESNINLKSTEKRPVIYDSYQFDAQKIVLDNNNYDKLKIDSISANKEALNITNFQIIPKYNKKELSVHLKKERDYIDLKIPKITLEKLDFNFDNPRLTITATSGEIVKPNVEIYRDKLIADDFVVKPLYS